MCRLVSLPQPNQYGWFKTVLSEGVVRLRWEFDDSLNLSLFFLSLPINGSYSIIHQPQTAICFCFWVVFLLFRLVLLFYIRQPTLLLHPTLSPPYSLAETHGNWG